MARQKANMSDLLKEQQKYEQLPSTAEQPEQEENTNTLLTQDSNTPITQNSKEALDQSTNTSTPQDTNTVLLQNDNEVIQENINTSQPKKRTSPSKPKQDTHSPKQQNSKISIPQGTNEVLSQKERMTDKRDRVSFYLNPGQLEKLEEVKIQYRKKTGIRINEQEIIRRAIDRLDVDFLL